MNPVIYFDPHQIGTYHRILSELEIVMSFQSDNLILAAHKTLPKKHSGFLIERVINSELSSLTHAQAALIHFSMCFVGAIDYNKCDDAEFFEDPIDFTDARFFRYSEEDLIRQLMLMKIENKQHGTVNDRIYAYKKNFIAYGYLHYLIDKNTYIFHLRDLWAIKGHYLLDAETLLQRIIQFRKFCQRAGIKNLRVELNNSTAILEPYRKILFNENIDFK